MNGAEAAPDDAVGALLSDDLRPDLDSYGCLFLSARMHEPAAVRQQFLKLSLRVHPDRNGGSTAAFQKLSTAFEILYDRDGQARHLAALRLRLRQKEKERKEEEDDEKRRKRGHETWKARAKEQRKRKRTAAGSGRGDGFWSEQRSWSAVVEELRRREQLERDFVRTKSDARWEQRVRGLVWRAMRIARSLDERAGCPPGFVNGCWAPLYEREVLQAHPGLPEGWEVVHAEAPKGSADGPPPPPLYRHAPTGEERRDHPSSEVARLLEKARAAERTNAHRFHSEPQPFLMEIVAYLREDHDYRGLDDDVAELEEEERARDGGERRPQAYDY